MNCNNVIELRAYQQHAPVRTENANQRAERILLRVESIVTGIIGVCTLICVGLVFSML